MTTAEKLEKFLTKTAPKEGGITGKVKVENLDASVLELIHKKQEVLIKLPENIEVTVPAANQIPTFQKALDDLLTGNNVFFVGAAGTGKTTLAETIANALNRDMRVITCNQWTSPTQIIGGQTIEGYKQGALIECWINGWILVLDEMPKMDANTAGVLNDALAKAAKPGAIIYDGDNQPHKKHKNFGVIATGNVIGKGHSLKYAGNNKQDASLLDRFSSSIYMVEFNRELEQSLVFPQVFEICDKMRNELLAMESEEIMTLRTMLNLNRIFVLEMEREMGAIPAVKGGKTLKDGLESYLAAMDESEAIRLKEKVVFDKFYNSYRNVSNYKKEKNRFA